MFNKNVEAVCPNFDDKSQIDMRRTKFIKKNIWSYYLCIRIFTDHSTEEEKLLIVFGVKHRKTCHSLQHHDFVKSTACNHSYISPLFTPMTLRQWLVKVFEATVSIISLIPICNTWGFVYIVKQNCFTIINRWCNIW